MSNIKQIEKILEQKYGKERFEIGKEDLEGHCKVLIHYPIVNIRVSSSTKTHECRDMWAKFKIFKGGKMASYKIEAARTTVTSTEPTDQNCHAHPHGGAMLGKWCVPCHGDGNTPINRNIYRLTSDYSEENFKSFLNALDVFMEYDNGGGLYHRLKQSKVGKVAGNLPKSYKKIKKELEEVLFSKLGKDHFGTSVIKNKFVVIPNDSLNELIMTTLNLREFQHNGLEDLFCTYSDGRYYSVERNDVERIVGEASFTFKGKKVKTKIANGNPEIYAHPKITERIVKELEKRIREGISSGKGTKLPGSLRNFAKIAAADISGL